MANSNAGISRGRAAAAALVLALLCAVKPASAEVHTAMPADVRCLALAKVDFSHTPDAPTQVLSSAVRKGDGKVPDFCEVVGYAWRNTEFRVRFPLQSWNGKLVLIGTGGQAGSMPEDDPFAATTTSGAQLSRGFALANHNSGHISSMTDAKWASNDDTAMIDYGYRSAHVANAAVRSILVSFYGTKVVRDYYESCSNGGREALMMAQRFPYDFDGIIAGAPSMLYGDLFTNLFWMSHLIKGGFTDEAAAILHKAVLAQCDRIDGKADGILDDPRKCHVDVARVTCSPALTGNCLTPGQAAIARNFYQGLRRPDGTQITRPSAMPGSELSWMRYFSWLGTYPDDVYRYLAFSPAAGPDFQPDIAKLDDYHRRMGVMDSLLTANNPDLRTFKANGGKLIVFFGWADPAGGILESIDYYQTVERVMGGPSQTQDFYRMFLMPGMEHCSGGQGASVYDYLGALDDWVDRGKAPAALRGYHPNADGSKGFERVVKPYTTARAG